MRLSVCSALFMTTIALPGSVAFGAPAITACGTETSHGVLTSDLDCSAEEVGVVVVSGGDLDLAGHTLIMGTVAGIVCKGSCRIDGNAAITAGLASYNDDKGSLTGNGLTAIDAEGWSAVVANLDVRGGTSTAVAASRVEMANCFIIGDTALGVRAGRVTLTDTMINGYDVGIDARKRVSLVSSSVTNGIQGILAGGKVDLADYSAVAGCSRSGIRARGVRASHSQINGSGQYLGYDEYCLNNPDECADILSVRRPKLDDTPCDQSGKLEMMPAGQGWQPSGETWGTCGSD
jgi:hypothetical protein